MATTNFTSTEAALNIKYHRNDIHMSLRVLSEAIAIAMISFEIQLDY